MRVPSSPRRPPLADKRSTSIRRIDSNNPYPLAGAASYSVVYVGSPHTASMTQSAYSLSISSNLYLGYVASAKGTYNLSGTGSISETNEYAGQFGTGTVNQTGGTNAVGNELGVGYSAVSNGSYTLSSGALSAGDEYIGYSGSGTFMQSAGSTNTVRGAIVVGVSSGSTGIYYLNGGTLLVLQVLGGASLGGNGTFDFDGGTLQATANSMTFMQGLTTANVQASGAFIDSNGYSITIAQRLVHDSTLGVTADGGLTKNGARTLTLSGANTSPARPTSMPARSWPVTRAARQPALGRLT